MKVRERSFLFCPAQRTTQDHIAYIEIFIAILKEEQENAKKKQGLFNS
jgi:hypothetical protein